MRTMRGGRGRRKQKKTPRTFPVVRGATLKFPNLYQEMAERMPSLIGVPSAGRTLSEGRRRCLSKDCRVYQGVSVRARRSNREHFHAASALGTAGMSASGVGRAGGCATKNSADVSRRPRSNPQVSQPQSGDGGGDAVSHRRPVRKTYFIGRDGAQASLSIAACIGMFRRSLLVAFQCILRRSPWRMRAAAAAIPLAVRPASSVSPALPWSQTAARTLSIVS